MATGRCQALAGKALTRPFSFARKPSVAGVIGSRNSSRHSPALASNALIGAGFGSSKTARVKGARCRHRPRARWSSPPASARSKATNRSVRTWALAATAPAPPRQRVENHSAPHVTGRRHQEGGRPVRRGGLHAAQHLGGGVGRDAHHHVQRRGPGHCAQHGIPFGLAERVRLAGRGADHEAGDARGYQALDQRRQRVVVNRAFAQRGDERDPQPGEVDIGAHANSFRTTTGEGRRRMRADQQEYRGVKPDASRFRRSPDNGTAAPVRRAAVFSICLHQRQWPQHSKVRRRVGWGRCATWPHSRLATDRATSESGRKETAEPGATIRACLFPA
jgi:hypothetical protein